MCICLAGAYQGRRNPWLTAHYRQELLQWMNSLCSLNLTRVEQCGTGAPFCAIYDSIFLDVPMARVKFNATADYAYLDNFKILSNTFRKHHIDRPIPVEMLVKCKMQDNLEFLQWTKRFWDQHYPGGDYDALARRKGQPGGPAPAPSARTSTATRRAPAVAASSAGARTRTPLGSSGGGAQTAALTQENNALKETVQGLERERDFYFSKLRDIELLVQGAMEAEPELEKDEGGLLKQIQTILYSTEEGFEIPAEVDDEEGELIEEETF
ncbi:hypothetical protein D6C84_04885 [Aureobasidium pullulans]|uniref:EB1 C-terminal domain-containing protein n=2 Tax=Aureobasidium pullulans TaxID=5580 RepID=A0A4S8SQI4_AURPU|nr:hypothetical protein JADG_005856 [Aureobasidium pullulans]THV73049.1 hypothetical protein D6D28_03536 [Aureobasidium pullulans]THW05145.1 hypothetical protein D6D26_02324 [Aureobasidium pullulans]THW11664.1 hypothetical protein D6D24_07062 [Aureobasidium pullulans]THW51254.1 hypothetical protein D6D25_04085 [Aureobasidium pullulans]